MICKLVDSGLQISSVTVSYHEQCPNPKTRNSLGAVNRKLVNMDHSRKDLLNAKLSREQPGIDKAKVLRGSASWRLEKIINKNSAQVLCH